MQLRTGGTLALVLALSTTLGSVRIAAAQTADVAADEEAVRALADSALAFITEENWVGFTDLYLPETQSFTVVEREGELRYAVRTREAWRAAATDQDIVERGFDATVHVQGHLATVWLPYDLYIDGAWSHCGIDAFTMIRTPGGWKIASLAWTVQQPPECPKHPDGPPEF